MAASNIHIIVGDDDYLVGEAAKKAVGDGVGLEVVDSRNSTNADLQLADIVRVESSVATPPFLEPKKVTWWKNVGFLPGGRSSEEVKLALEKFAKKLAASPLPENQVFVLTGTHLLKTSVFAKTLAKCAEITVYSAGKSWEAAKMAVVRATEFAKEEQLVFAPGVAERFVAIVGSDARSIRSEVAKLRAYLGKEKNTVGGRRGRHVAGRRRRSGAMGRDGRRGAARRGGGLRGACAVRGEERLRRLHVRRDREVLPPDA